MFAIKNQEGEYYAGVHELITTTPWGSTENYGFMDDWSSYKFDAEKYETREQAEEYSNSHFKDCEVIELK